MTASTSFRSMGANNIKAWCCGWVRNGRVALLCFRDRGLFLCVNMRFQSMVVFIARITTNGCGNTVYGVPLWLFDSQPPPVPPHAVYVIAHVPAASEMRRAPCLVRCVLLFADGVILTVPFCFALFSFSAGRGCFPGWPTCSRLAFAWKTVRPSLTPSPLSRPRSC